MKPTLNTRTSRRLVPRDATSERFLEVRIDTPVREDKERAPLNLALVIDRSGSMSGEKLARAKQAAEHVLDQLRDRDRVSIVVYDHEVNTIAPSEAATEEHIRRCRSALREIHSGGTTALFDGWLNGCNGIADFIKLGVASRVLLLTDGLANVGLTTSSEICNHVSALFERGISTSTFGIGADFDEDLLSDMADAGRGRFYYIEHAGLIPDAFRQEFGDLASVIASDSRLKLETSDDIDIAVELLGGMPHESDKSRIVVPIGDLYEGESRPFYFRLKVAGNATAGKAQLTVTLMARPGESGETTVSEVRSIAFEYANAERVAAERVDEELMRKVADVDIAQARIEAMTLNRAGDYAAATQSLRQRVARYRDFRSDELLHEDTEIAYKMESAMDPVYRKKRKLEAMRRSRVRRNR